MSNKEFELEGIAKMLMGCVEDTFGKTYNIFFSKDPECVERNIIEYKSRMRTFGLEKFNAPCYVSAINFYVSPKALERQDSVGVLILYLKEEHAVKVLRAMGFTTQEDDEALLLDCIGELTSIIAEQFKNKLLELKYQDLTIAPPQTAKNDIAEGVWFKYSENVYHELSFYLWNEKSLAISLSLAPIKQQ